MDFEWTSTVDDTKSLKQIAEAVQVQSLLIGVDDNSFSVTKRASDSEIVVVHTPSNRCFHVSISDLLQAVATLCSKGSRLVVRTTIPQHPEVCSDARTWREFVGELKERYFDAESNEDVFHDATNIENQAARKVQEAFRKRFYIRDSDGSSVVDPIHFKPIRRGRGMLLNKQWYDRNSIRQSLLSGQRKVPHTRRLLTAAEIQTASGPQYELDDDTMSYVMWGFSKLAQAPPLCTRQGQPVMALAGQRADDTLIGDRLMLLGQGKIKTFYPAEASIQLLASDHEFLEPVLTRLILDLGDPKMWQIVYQKQVGPRSKEMIELNGLHVTVLDAFLNSPSYNYRARFMHRAIEARGTGASIMNANGFLVDS